MNTKKLILVGKIYEKLKKKYLYCITKVLIKISNNILLISTVLIIQKLNRFLKQVEI